MTVRHPPARPACSGLPDPARGARSRSRGARVARPWVAAWLAGLATAAAWAGPPDIVAPPGFSGSASALGSTITGATGGGFLDGRTHASAKIDVAYEVVGLAEWTPVTFHYTFSGDLQAVADNASVGLGANFHFGPLTDIGLIHYTNWGVNWVDGPAFMGDFAGNRFEPIYVSAAGYEVPTTWSPAVWNGDGVVTVSSVLPLRGGQVGVLGHEVVLSLSGQVGATLQVQLVGLSMPEVVVLPNAAANPLGAAGQPLASPVPYLLFEDGTRMEILTSPVPEPATQALWLLGLGALGWCGRARRRALSAA